MPMVEYSWVIELNGTTQPPMYYCGGVNRWTADSLNALRFVDHETALAYAEKNLLDPSAYKIVEHGWA